MPTNLKYQGPRWLWALLLYTFSIDASHAKHWQFYTEQNPPFNYVNKGQVTGFAPALVQALLKRLDQSGDIQLLPWARAYHNTQQEDQAALITTIRTPEREHLFKWVGPLIKVDVGFYALKHSQITINNPTELAQLPKIGALRASFNYNELKNMGPANVVGVTTTRQLFRILVYGRAQVIVADNFSVNTQVEAFGLSASDIELVYPHKQVYGYLAFNINTADEEVARWQQALDELKGNGEFSRLYQQWLPQLGPPDLTGITP